MTRTLFILDGPCDLKVGHCTVVGNRPGLHGRGEQESAR